MPATLPSDLEPEFQRLWCSTTTPSHQIREWLRSYGIETRPGTFGAKLGLVRYSTHRSAAAERAAIHDLNAPEPVRQDVVRKPTPEERAARRVPVGGYRMGSVRL